MGCSCALWTRRVLCIFFLTWLVVWHHTAAQGGSGKIEHATPRFTSARSFALDPGGNAYVLDEGKSELLQVAPTGRIVNRTGGYGWSSGSFDKPTDVIAPNGIDVYVVDFGNHRIQRFDRNLNYVGSISGRGSRQLKEQFGYPLSVSLSRSGELFLIDGENIRIVKFDATGSFERSFGDIGSGSGRLRSPVRVRVSPDDKVYVQDVDRIVVFDVFGNYLSTIRDSAIRVARSIAVDQDRLYILDSCRIHVLTNGSHKFDELAIDPSLSQPLCNGIDLAVQGDRITLLTRRELVTVRVPVVKNERNGQ